MTHNSSYVASVSESTAVAVRVTAEVASPTASGRTLRDAWTDEFDSESTRDAYKRDYDHLARFLAERNIAVRQAHRTDISEWRESMRIAGLSKATIARRLSAASSFYEFCISLDLLEHNPARGVKRPKIQYDEDGTVWLSLDQMDALLEAAARDGLRSEVLIAILTSTGARIEEVLAARVKDYGHRANKRVLTATIKGGARHDYVIVDWVAARIDAYLAGRKDGSLIQPDPRKNNPGRFTYPTALRLIRRLAGEAAIPLASHVHPHSIRHSHITDARAGGATLEDTQRSMRHKDTKTTQRYDHGRLNLDKSTANIVGARLAPGRSDRSEA